MEPTNQGEVPQEAAKLSHVIQIDEGKIQAHLVKWFAAQWKRR